MFVLPTEERGQALKRLIEEYGPLQRLIKQMDKWPSIRETTAETVMQLVNVERLEAVELLKKLERSRLGQFVTGRRGGKTRIIWRYNPKKLYQLVKNEKLADGEKVLDAITSKAPLTSDERIVPPVLAEYKFMLRKDYELTIQLPRDLMMKDAERLCGWVRTLPLD